MARRRKAGSRRRRGLNRRRHGRVRMFNRRRSYRRRANNRGRRRLHRRRAYNRGRRRRHRNPAGAMALGSPMSAIRSTLSKQNLVKGGIMAAGALGNDLLADQIVKIAGAYLPGFMKKGQPGYYIIGLGSAALLGMGARMVPVQAVRGNAGALALGAVLGQVMRAANEYLTPVIKGWVGSYGLGDFLSVSDAQRAQALGDYLSVQDSQRAVPLGEMTIAEELAGA